MKKKKTIYKNYNSQPQNNNVSTKWRILLPLAGFFSLIWFLIRVIPKPSRALYPCQRLAFPVASGFILWLISLFSSIVLFKKIKVYLNKRKLVRALFLFVIFLFVAGLAFFHLPSQSIIADDEPFVPTDPANSPMGEAQGLFPGRVVWSHNTEATSWNGTGYWTDDKFTNQVVVNEMVSQSLRALTGNSNETKAWDNLFRSFNKSKGTGDRGYQQGEKIAIKINLNACSTHDNNRNKFFTSPQVSFAILQQLVENAGVYADNITFYDATRFIPKSIYDKCKAVYPTVVFADWEGGDGRQKIERETSVQVKFSQKLTLEPDGGNPTYLPRCVAQADYLINIGQLKGHNLAGITLNGKNLFGSIVSYPPNNQPQSSAPKNAGCHPYICVHSDFHFGGHWDFEKRDMGTYNVLVDLMGFEHLGGKTMLYIIDGLYSAPDQSTDLQTDHKWKSFDNDWPNSLFMSQDNVAIESVCLDFLRNEPGQIWVRGNIDNYLHEAALANNPPSGVVYDPEQDGLRLKSLGVHEHWNNPTDKKYTRNLGTGNGIELVMASSISSVKNNQNILQKTGQMIENYPNPFNPVTSISFILEQSGYIKLEIYDMLGQKIKTLESGFHSAGQYTILWNGDNDRGLKVSSGIYMCHLFSENQIEICKMMLVR